MDQLSGRVSWDHGSGFVGVPVAWIGCDHAGCNRVICAPGGDVSDALPEADQAGRGSDGWKRDYCPDHLTDLDSVTGAEDE